MVPQKEVVNRYLKLHESTSHVVIVISIVHVLVVVAKDLVGGQIRTVSIPNCVLQLTSLGLVEQHREEILISIVGNCFVQFVSAVETLHSWKK